MLKRLLSLQFAGVLALAVVCPDAGWGKIDDGGEEHCTVNIVRVVNAHTEYHEAHEECGEEQICFEQCVFGTEEVYPDTCHMAAEEEIFGERGIVRVDGVLEEEVAEDDHASGRLESNHKYADLPDDCYRKVHFYYAEDGVWFMEVGYNEQEKRRIKQQENMRREIVAGKEAKQRIFQVNALSCLHIITYALCDC